MPASWPDDLNRYLVALGISTGPTAEFIKWCKRHKITDGNHDARTLEFLRRLADTAIEMTARLLPVEVGEEIRVHLAGSSPEELQQLVALILSAAPQHPLPAPQIRRNVAQLIFATRAVPRHPTKLDESTLSPIQTARFLAMWSTIYWTYATEHDKNAADELTYG